VESSPVRPEAASAVAATPSDVADVITDAGALWEALQHATGEYVVVVDRSGVIRWCNRVDDGFSREQVIGQSITAFTLPESAISLAEMLRQVFETGEVRGLETTVRRLDGGLSHFSIRLGPIRRAGRSVAVIACCQNIRPLKDTEQALTRERSVLAQLLEIQERERQLVSYDIHDGLAQYLAGAIMHVQACEASIGDGVGGRELHEAMRLLRAAVDESRRLIGGLRPPALDELGIVDAIESLVGDARTEVPEVRFDHDLPGPRLPPTIETAIFRIVQESLSNVRKHADARTAQVALSRDDGVVVVRVVDDGRGFDPRAVPGGRFGLEGIRQRARLFDAEPRIESAPGRGTVVEVRLPVAAGRAD